MLVRTISRRVYGGKFWVAKIVGSDPKFGLSRIFCGKRDVTNSRNKYRDIEIDVPVEGGAIYEWFAQITSGRSERGFWIVRDGEIVEIDRAAVMAALAG